MEGSEAASPTATSASKAIITAPRISTGTRSCGSRSPRIRSRSSSISNGLAIHPRSRHKEGRRIKIEEHFPPNSVAYYESTPQKLLSQSRFIHPDLNALFVELFNADVYGHLRRAQGFVRSLHEGNQHRRARGRQLSASVSAIATMRRYNRYRVSYFQDLLAQARKQTLIPRGWTAKSCAAPVTPCCVTSAAPCRPPTLDAAVPSTINQESLDL